MLVKSLSLANVRAFKQAAFEFQPGMNLLVGVNGAGKSTVLDVLRRMYAAWLPSSTQEPSGWSRSEDIRFDQQFMSIQAEIDLYGQPLFYTFQLQHAEIARRPDSREGDVRDTTYDVPQIDELKDVDGRRVVRLGSRDPGRLPLALFVSPHRSVIEPSRRVSISRRDQAFVLALEPRGLNVQEMAQWWLVQDALRREEWRQPPLIAPEPFDLLAVINSAVSEFLNTYGEIHATSESKPSILLTKNGTELDIRQLSDGERSIIAVVVDLARRLALANPGLDNPIKDGRAIVLIDELDLHLHPAWQRIICQRLTDTFQNCQFIATTHSPQIIGEVPAEQIQIIDDGEVIRPRQTLGMDTNWILKYIMGVSDRSKSTREMLEQIETLIENDAFDDALRQIAEVRNLFGDFPELAALQAQIEMIDFLADEDEADTE